MRTARGFLAIPLLLAASAALASGSEVRDKAGIFGPDAVRKANADLTRIERETGMPVIIETIPTLNGMAPAAALRKIAGSEKARGLFVLIAAKETKVQVEASPDYDRYFNRPRYDAIVEGFVPGFRSNSFDTGLAGGVAKIEGTLVALKSEAGGTLAPATRVNAAPGRRPVGAQVPAQARPKTDFTSLIGIVVLVIAAIIVFKIIGGIFNAATRGNQAGGGGPGGMMQGPGQGFGGPGYGGGGGPGYGGGGPGYGGGGGARGGGFMSGLLGGVGGAVAGNWLYDKFGRSHQAGYGGAPAEPGAAPEQGGDWNSANSGTGADWGDGGGGSGGGGGDWGGGGGDGGGGGGGDWGGGGGGGDWGGGGGDGGGGGW